jgi:Flp pilus assembly protein TadD
MPEGLDAQYNPVDMNLNYGKALFDEGRYRAAALRLSEAVRRAPSNAEGHLYLAMALASQDEVDKALAEAQKALDLAREAGNDSLAQQSRVLVEVYRRRRR